MLMKFLGSLCLSCRSQSFFSPRSIVKCSASNCFDRENNNYSMYRVEIINKLNSDSNNCQYNPVLECIGIALPYQLNPDLLKATLGVGEIISTGPRIGLFYLDTRKLSSEEIATMKLFQQSISHLQTLSLPSEYQNQYGFYESTTASRSNILKHIKCKLTSLNDQQPFSNPSPQHDVLVFPLQPWKEAEIPRYSASYTKACSLETLLLINNLHTIYQNNLHNKPNIELLNIQLLDKLVQSNDTQTINPAADDDKIIYTTTGKDLVCTGISQEDDPTVPIQAIMTKNMIKGVMKKIEGNPQAKALLANNDNNTFLAAITNTPLISSGTVLSSKLTLINYLTNIQGVRDLIASKSVAFSPLSSQEIGRYHWLQLALLLPNLLFMFQAMLQMNTLKTAFLKKVISDNKLVTEKQKALQGTIDQVYSIDQLLQATTTVQMLEPGRNYDKLEVLGDAFLKFALTLIWLLQPLTTAADKTSSSSELWQSLNTQRLDKLSNERLCALALKAGIPQYLRNIPVSKGLKELTFSLPNHFGTNLASSVAVSEEVIWTKALRNQNIRNPASTAALHNSDDDNNAAADNTVASSTLPVSSKVYADVLEALIGVGCASTTASSPHKSIHDLQFLFEVCTSFDLITRTEMDAVFPLADRQHNRWQYPETAEVFVSDKTSTKVKQMESLLGYTFQQREHGIYAITHTSLCNGNHPELQRLYETQRRFHYLGEALFEYLVMEYLYHLFVTNNSNNSNNSQDGDLIVVDEGFFTEAKIMLRNEYFLSKQIFIMWPSFLDNQEYSHSMVIDDQNKSTLISDGFLALLGSVFFDSQGDFHLIRKILHKLGILSMKQSEIDQLVQRYRKAIIIATNNGNKTKQSEAKLS